MRIAPVLVSLALVLGLVPALPAVSSAQSVPVQPRRHGVPDQPQPSLPGPGVYSQTPSARAAGQQIYQDSSGDQTVTHPNLLGGQTYRNPDGSLILTQPSIMGREVIQDEQGRATMSAPNAAGGQTYRERDGSLTFCRPSVNDQYYCQPQSNEPGLANPRRIRDRLEAGK